MSSLSRDEAARRFAELMGWTFLPSGRGSCFRYVDSSEQCDDHRFRYFDFPAPDAPLHEKLACVGRIAEAVGPGSLERVQQLDYPTEWRVQFFSHAVTRDDLVHAALLAGIAAKEAK